MSRGDLTDCFCMALLNSHEESVSELQMLVRYSEVLVGLDQKLRLHLQGRIGLLSARLELLRHHPGHIRERSDVLPVEVAPVLRRQLVADSADVHLELGVDTELVARHAGGAARFSRFKVGSHYVRLDDHGCGTGIRVFLRGRNEVTLRINDGVVYSSHWPARLHIMARGQHESDPVLIALAHIFTQVTTRGSIAIAPPSLRRLDAQVSLNDGPVTLPSGRQRAAPRATVLFERI
mmetsp:Transcript_29155/g.55059  ORF Transcript_29155/g.55059 Transcript_29155/m.55059 type:complete len:235 (-) Transcript_29155:230-934(-)